MTHAERMAAIRAREAAATPGPWLLEPNKNSYRVINSERGDEVIFDGSVGEYGGPFTNWNADPPFIAHARSDIPYLLARVETLEAALREATNALMYIGDKAVVDWDGETVGEADSALAKLPDTYRESYINFMRVATKIWTLVIVGADMELNTITLLCESGGVKMGETLGALFYRRLTAIKEGTTDAD